MFFTEKVSQTQTMMWSFQPETQIKVLGTEQEEFNYRNKCVYTFNLLDSKLDQFTFKIIGLDQVKIIQYINMVVNLNYRVKQGVFAVNDIFIKNNWREEYQICLAISCQDTGKLDDIIKFIFSVVKKLVTDLDIKIVSGYYYLENKKIGLKEKEFHLFYGEAKLVEQISIVSSSGESKKTEEVTDIQIQLSPYSFSRINYRNSLLIYQKMWELTSQLPDSYRYILFGRDLYFPMKILAGLPRAVSFYGITHCPITYRDIAQDTDTELPEKCQLVGKKDYGHFIQRHFDSLDGVDTYKFVLVMTAGRNGLGQKMSSLLNANRDKIHRIMYIGCSVENMKKDFSYLLPTYTVDDIWISNEFSHTNFNNNIAWLK